MASFIIVVIKLSIIKDDNVGSFTKIQLFICLLYTFAYARKYDLTSKLKCFRLAMKDLYINNYKAILYLKYMWLFLIRQVFMY